MSIKMKELPTSERPYEKLEMYGENTLTNAELLAIIIKNGTKDESSITLAQKILSLGQNKKCTQDNLKFLQELSIQEFMQIKGIGKIKAIQLKAVCELAKRISKPIQQIKTTLHNTEEVAAFFMDELKQENIEIVKVVIMNSKNEILKIQTITQGNSKEVQMSISSIIAEVIKMSAQKFIIVHNHPSGDPTPSKQDISLTKTLEEATKILNIQLLDHIIIGYNKYGSVIDYIQKHERNMKE